jgi:hypothetical protein
MDGAFQWASPLGVGVGLFLASAAFHFLIGVLTPVGIRLWSNDDILIASKRSDTKAFGTSPPEMIAKEPAIATYRNVMWTIVAGFLVALAVVEGAVAWFGLRAGAPWALVALAAEGIVLVAFWILAFGPYFAARAPLTLADLPPFMWVPGLLLVPAAILSWIGLRG